MTADFPAPRCTASARIARASPSSRPIPSVSCRMALRDTAPVTATRYSFSTPWDGCWSRLARAPSLVRRSKPSDSRSSRPTGNTRGPFGMNSARDLVACGSRIVLVTPLGLFSAKYRSRGCAGTGTPSTVIRSTRGSTRSPSRANRRPTRTRPCSISSSAFRLEPYPARASVFWSRSGPPPPVDSVPDRRPLVVVIPQERGGGAVQDGPSGTVVSTDLLDQTPIRQCPQDSVGVGAPDTGDLMPGHGLLVGHDGERLQRGLGEPGMPRGQDELLDVGCRSRMGHEPPPSGHLLKNDPRIPGFVFARHVQQQLLHLAPATLDGLSQNAHRDRLVGQEQDRFQGPPDLVRYPVIHSMSPSGRGNCSGVCSVSSSGMVEPTTRLDTGSREAS